MSGMNDMVADGAGQEMTLTRIFDAPRDMVFRMWTDPVHLAQWWGPHGFMNPVCEVDARVGGAIRMDAGEEQHLEQRDVLLNRRPHPPVPLMPGESERSRPRRDSNTRTAPRRSPPAAEQRR